MARKINPWAIATAGWTFVLLLAALWLADWRYRYSYEVPTVTSQGDKGFRFDLSKRLCIDQNGAPGVSQNHLGPCGVVKDLALRRAKVENHVLIAGTVASSTFTNVIFDWVSGHGSRWSEIKLTGGKFWDSEFPFAEFRGVKFQGTDLRGVSFNGAKFIDCEFKDVEILDSSFRNATLVRTVFLNSVCSSCDFSGAKFEESSIDRPFEKAVFNLETVLPFPIEQVERYGFEFRD